MGTSVIFVNRFFHPDHSATSQMLTDLAVALARCGVTVKVVASRSCYDDPGAAYPRRGNVNGVEIHRVWTTRFGRASLPSRAVDYLTFYLSASAAVFRLARRRDTVVAKTDPPLLSVPLVSIARFKRAIPANWLQDVFPEVAVKLGLPVPEWAAAPLRFLRNWSLRLADFNVAISDSMARYLEGQGVPGSRIRVVHNWSEGVAPVPPTENELRRQWGLADRFVVGYSGNMGRAHDLEPVLAAAKRLQSRRGDVVFLFIGGGKQRSSLEREAEKMRLTNVLFKPYQPRAQLAQSLGAADVHIVSLRPEVEGLVVPSKFYGIAAAGRPMVFIGARSGDLGRLILQEQCGHVVEPGDVDGLTRVVDDMATDAVRRREMGKRARRMFEQRFTKDRATAEWLQLLGVTAAAGHDELEIRGGSVAAQVAGA